MLGSQISLKYCLKMSLRYIIIQMTVIYNKKKTCLQGIINNFFKLHLRLNKNNGLFNKGQILMCSLPLISSCASPT